MRKTIDNIEFGWQKTAKRRRNRWKTSKLQLKMYSEQKKRFLEDFV